LRYYLEFDQMLLQKGGAEYSLSPEWGVKGCIGLSVSGITIIGYELLGVHHLEDVDNRFQWNIKLGLPVA